MSQSLYPKGMSAEEYIAELKRALAHLLHAKDDFGFIDKADANTRFGHLLEEPTVECDSQEKK